MSTKHTLKYRIEDNYEARTPLGLGVSRCPTRFGVRHSYDTCRTGRYIFHCICHFELVVLQDIVNDRINGCLKHGDGDAEECSVCDETGKCILNQEAGSQRNV